MTTDDRSMTITTTADKPILVIYHKNCHDGFACAYLLTKYFGADNVKLHAAAHGDEPPDCTGHATYLVDFTYSNEQMLKMQDDACLLYTSPSPRDS